MKLPISIGILSWNSNQTLRNTLESYKRNGLLDIVNDVTILFQEVSETDKQIAKEYNLQTILLDQNIGIGAAFKLLAQNAKSEHLILLEHDWELIENKETTYKRLSSGLELLQNGYSCVRYRHRRNPGVPLYTLEPYKGKELEFYDHTTELNSPHLLDCIHWTDLPEQKFCDKIQKDNEYFVTTSRWGNWTNNPCLYKKQFFINAISQFLGTGIELERNISKWWAHQEFKVAHGEGLFTHNDIQKYKPMNSKKDITVFYHLFIPDTNNMWVWWIDEQMSLLRQTGLADEARINMCVTIPLGLFNSKTGHSYDEMVLDYIKDRYPFVNIIDIRSTNERENLYEGQTLAKLYEHCLTNDGYVFYFHNKGMVSYTTHISGAIKDWRHYMQYFNVEKWQDCVAKLDEGYDCCGVDWVERHDIKLDFVVQHYAGNFWWARNDYIRKLKHPLKIEEYMDVEAMMRELQNYRYCFELWMATGIPKQHCFHYRRHHQYDNQGLERYFTYFPPEMYRDDLPDTGITKKYERNKLDILMEVGSKNLFNWRDHRQFADWLVRRKQPQTIVDLGVDYGYSTFCFAIPEIGHVYGIDSFEGDICAGERDTYDYVLKKKEELGLNNLTVIKGFFDDVIKTWNKPIDILHVDGLHTYEAVKNDFRKWSSFVKDDGIILMHDTMVDDPKFGVGRFFKEISLPKTNFKHCNGLGIVSKDINLIEEIKKNFGEFIQEI